MLNRVCFTRFLNLALLQFCVVCLVACTDAATNPDTSGKTPVISAQPPTAFPMPPLSGKSLRELGWEVADGQRGIVGDYKSKVLVLDFYATWCMPCRESVPHLIKLQKQYENEGLRIVGLNVGGPGDPERVSDFARELGIQYSLAIPDSDLVSFLLSDSNDIPQTFVFDRQGLLTKRFVGFGSATAEEISRAVEDALRPPTPKGD